MEDQTLYMQNIKESDMRDGLKLYDVKEKPFKIYGVSHDGELFRRVPQDIADNISDGISWASKLTAGGRVRFTTNSPYITVACKWRVREPLAQMPMTGSCGFDLYIYSDGKEEHRETFCPDPESCEKGYSCTKNIGWSNENKVISINFPLYNNVDGLYIGIKEGSTLIEAPEYKHPRPIVFYGSSITQGACASRPGMSYEAIVSRHFDTDYINLGFAGNAKGEDKMADYISSLDMSVLVIDYDHNAPDVKHLEDTHERFFKRIRAKHPTLPIIIMSAPEKRKTSLWWQGREEIIKKTYDNALSVGDKNVYFIQGAELMTDNDGLVDGIHPQDHGFMSMAKRIIKELEIVI